jgi:hypothetical protein
MSWIRINYLETGRLNKTFITDCKTATMGLWPPKRKKKKQPKKERTYSKINPEGAFITNNNLNNIYYIFFTFDI